MLRGKRAPSDAHAFFGADRRAIQTAPGGTVEIDELRDLYWAEAVLRAAQDQPALAGRIEPGHGGARRRMRMAS